jgi:hypothetical protein
MHTAILRGADTYVLVKDASGEYGYRVTGDPVTSLRMTAERERERARLAYIQAERMERAARELEVQS